MIMLSNNPNNRFFLNTLFSWGGVHTNLNFLTGVEPVSSLHILASVLAVELQEDDESFPKLRKLSAVIVSWTAPQLHVVC